MQAKEVEGRTAGVNIPKSSLVLVLEPLIIGPETWEVCATAQCNRREEMRYVLILMT